MPETLSPELGFDHTLCPICRARMQFARAEARPLQGSRDFERHVYRCARCANVSRFVVDIRARPLLAAFRRAPAAALPNA